MRWARCHRQGANRRWRVGLRWALSAFLGFAFLSAPGCVPPYNDVLIGEDGEPIRNRLLFQILNDPNLSELQKREILHDFGITDDNLIDFLIFNAG